MPKKNTKKESNQITAKTTSTKQYASPIWKIIEENREELVNQLILKNTSILNAIIANDLDAIKSFVEAGFSFPEPKRIPELALVREDNVELIRYLVKESKLDLNDLKNTKDGTTILIKAVLYNASKCISFLVEEGLVDINEKGSRGCNYSPLQFAIMYNKPKIAKLLIQLKAKFDQETFEILAQSNISVQNVDSILQSVGGDFKSLKKTYTNLKRGQHLQEIKDEKDYFIDYMTLCGKVVNNYYKLVFLKEDHLLPKIIKEGQVLLTEGFKNFNNKYGKEHIENLLNCLTDIYRISVENPQNYEKFEDFLVDALDKLNDKAFILEFTKILFYKYQKLDVNLAKLLNTPHHNKQEFYTKYIDSETKKINFGKMIRYGEKIYKILNRTEESNQEKLKVLEILIYSYIGGLENKEKLTFYKRELVKLIIENPTLEISPALINVISIELYKSNVKEHYNLDTINASDNTPEDYLYAETAGILKHFQLKGEWEKGYKHIEKIYEGADSLLFKSHNNLDLKYYEFIFHYHKDKDSPKAEEILDYFYEHALRNKDKLCLINTHKLYKLVIYQELENRKEEKLLSYLEKLKILPRTSYIQSLQDELECWINSFKAPKVGEEHQQPIEETKAIAVKEEAILRLPKEESKTFEEIERLLSFEDFTEIAKIDQKLLRKYFTHKKAELEKEKYVEETVAQPQTAWCIKGKIYKSNEVKQIDKDGKWYAVISDKSLKLGDIKSEQYQNALEHALAKRAQGSIGIKCLQNGLELKMPNTDNRLLAKCYKNSEEKYLAIFKDEKPHSQIKANTGEFVIYPDDNSVELPLVGENC